MRVTEYEMITYETIHIPTRGEWQDFIQVQNLSGLVLMQKVVKLYIYINLHILLNILSKTTSNIQVSRKSIKSLK